MKEQVISPRGVRRSAAQPRGPVQRPARRPGASSRPSFSPRALFAYVPSALKAVLAIAILITLVVGYRAAASASLFQVRTIDVTGTARTSAEEIEGFTRRAVTRTGVWRTDLTAISNELSRLPGVKRAVVTRVLPDRLRVRVIERVPLAVVRTSAGHFVWVDEDAVALGEMKPADRMPIFFIHGWNDDGTDEARQENMERMKRYQEAVRDWGAAGLSERVSEITLIDLKDIRAQLAGNDSQIEVRLGSQDVGQRLKIALEALDMYRQTARGSSITYVDMQTGRVVIGFSSGNKVTEAASTAPDSKTPEPVARPNDVKTDSQKTGLPKDSATDRRRNNEKKTDAAKNKSAKAPVLRFR